MMRIEIVGNIASGKTTLTSLFENDLYCLYEDFRANPFWASFYRDPGAFSFETEISFTLQHYHQIKCARLDQTMFICDFSVVLDRAYAEVTLSSSRRDLYMLLLDDLISEIALPDIIVLLECPEETLLDRIRKRGRTVEDSISIDYLKALGESIYRGVDRVSKVTKIVCVDSGGFDFAHDAAIQRGTKELVMSQFSQFKK